MIHVTGFDTKEFILNADQIEKIEEVPESIITLVNGKKYIVLESNEEIIKRVEEYKRRIFNIIL
jgi:flagellar protein FlbD